MKITEDEWERIANHLNVKVEDIKEEDISSINFNNENAKFSDQSGNDNVYYNIPEFVVDYIELLKKENAELKEKLNH